ncbi:thermonuclease family protein [Palleronia sp. LCG004]|uniref:thermonuclease family protein n=1 Tax=Palleronia sp. LCG004 TaxID=3079304 RepID=UPI003979752A
MAAAVAFATSFSLSPIGADAAVLTGSAEVTDGDTIKLGVVPVRIHGVDAPEDGQRCELPTGGRWSCDDAARDRLADLVEGREIRCDLQDVDAYGRLVSICYAGVVDAGEALAAEGLAWAFTEYVDVDAAGLGLWRDGADPQTPWDYRSNRWERAAAASPRPGCPINDNIGGGGEKIYHTPWSKYSAERRLTRPRQSSGSAMRAKRSRPDGGRCGPDRQTAATEQAAGTSRSRSHAQRGSGRCANGLPESGGGSEGARSGILREPGALGASGTPPSPSGDASGGAGGAASNDPARGVQRGGAPSGPAEGPERVRESGASPLASRQRRRGPGVQPLANDSWNAGPKGRSAS